MLSFIMRFERDPDRDRFAALYQMNHTRMERLARQLLGDQNRAEDAVHDTFMKLIRRMPEDYRRVLELRFVAEWSISDIARELGLTESAVRTRTFRGRKLLIDTLKKEGYLDERATV